MLVPRRGRAEGRAGRRDVCSTPRPQPPTHARKASDAAAPGTLPVRGSVRRPNRDYNPPCGALEGPRGPAQRGGVEYSLAAVTEDTE